ncbi:hypothetical protein GOODEAATRI_021761 [Goodea atripinnis]|uniref:C2H2-type domain-containing protein n=1 Tax=Goodea atripinnis TaxID=208336 RepID=A0ABV0NCK4_9TELE
MNNVCVLQVTMASYTCISCRVAFADGEVQRAHYKTDWHRYNLKRKVADMPPVTAENFQERVLVQRATAEQQLSDAAATESCAVCNKKFSSANAYQNHLQSHKHQQAERQALLAAQRKVEKMNEKNLEKGVCDEKEDNDAKNNALQQVLREQQRLSPAKLAKVQTQQGAAKAEKPPRMMWLEEQVKRHEMMDQEEVGSTGTSDSLPGSIPVTDCLFCSHHSKSLLKNVAHMTTVHSFFIPDVEFLVNLKGLIRYLGAKIGHRSLMRYYKQRFGMQRTVVLSHSRNAVGRVLRQYKALGWTGDAGESWVESLGLSECEIYTHSDGDLLAVWDIWVRTCRDYFNTCFHFFTCNIICLFSGQCKRCDFRLSEEEDDWRKILQESLVVALNLWSYVAP